MARHRKKFEGQCAYCETVGRLTQDHVIPECLFERGKAPADAPIAYACKTCNNTKKNLDDSFLRDMLVADIATYDHPVARDLFKGPMMRVANAKGHVHSPIAQMVRNNQGRQMHWMSTGGIYLGEVFRPDIPQERIWRIFSTIVRGLYLAYTDTALPDGVRISLDLRRDMDAVSEEAQGLLDSGGVHNLVGDGSVFQCVYGVVPDRPDVSLWFLIFYEHLAVVVMTEHPDLPEVETSKIAAKPELFPSS